MERVFCISRLQHPTGVFKINTSTPSGSFHEVESRHPRPRKITPSACLANARSIPNPRAALRWARFVARLALAKFDGRHGGRPPKKCIRMSRTLPSDRRSSRLTVRRSRRWAESGPARAAVLTSRPLTFPPKTNPRFSFLPSLLPYQRRVACVPYRIS